MIKINLLTEEQEKTARTNRRRMSVVAVGLFLVGIAVGLFLLEKYSVPPRRPSIQTRPALSGGETTEKIKEGKGRQVGGVTESSQQDTAKEYSFWHILSDIQVNIPPSVCLIMIGFVLPEECFIQGKAGSASLVKELAQRLERLSGVKKIGSPAMERHNLKGGTAELEFTIWMEMELLSGGGPDLAGSMKSPLSMVQIRRQAEKCGAVLDRWILKKGRLTFCLTGKLEQIESFLATSGKSNQLLNPSRLFILPAEGENLNWERVRACFCF